MAHHGQKVGFGTVGPFGFFTCLNQLGDGGMLLPAGLFKAIGQIVDVLGQTAQFAIVDDRLLRVGSSNLNNRSLGLDSECDVTIDAALPANLACGGNPDASVPQG